MPYDPRYGLVPDGWTGPQRSPTLSRYGAAASARGYNTSAEADRYNAAQGRRRFLTHTVLPVAAFATGGAALGAMGGAGAAGGAASTGASAANPFLSSVAAPASRFSLGNILKMAEVGVPAITGLFANRSQNRALDRQAQAEQHALMEQMAFAREQEQQRRAEAERMFIEDQRRWDAEERNRGREITAADDERGFTRRLIEEREARRAPLRAAAGPALIRLQELMRMGRRR